MTTGVTQASGLTATAGTGGAITSIVAGSGLSGGGSSGAVTVSLNLPTFVPTAATAAAIQTAITAAGAAGGGIVQLPSGTISLSASLVPVSGVKLRGVPPTFTYTSIPDSNTIAFAGGTVLNPSGAFPAIAWNTSVLGTPASQGAFSSLALNNISFEDLGFSGAGGGTWGIQAGNTNNASCWWSQFKNLYFIGFGTGGMSITNYQHCEFIGNYAFNNAWGLYHGIDVASATLAPGNSTYYDFYCVNSSTLGNTSRNITFLTTAALAAAADNNQFKMDRIQSNRFTGGAQTQAATMTNTVATFTVTDGTKYPIGIPVSFSATVNGFTLGKTYFVVSNSTNTISVSATYGGTAVTATGSTAVNITTTGFPCLEMIALSGSAMTNMVIDNLDVEGLATCAALFQNANGMNVQFSQVPGVAQAPISVCFRGCVNKTIIAPQSVSTDDDQNAVGAASSFYGAKFGTSVGYQGMGLWYDSISNKSVLSMGNPFDKQGAGTFTYDPSTASGILMPQNMGMGQLPKFLNASGAIAQLNTSYTNVGATAAMTLSALVAGTNGAWFEYFNQSATSHTITTAGELVNGITGRTVVTIAAGAFARFTAVFNTTNSTYTWVTASAMVAGLISAPT